MESNNIKDNTNPEMENMEMEMKDTEPELQDKKNPEMEQKDPEMEQKELDKKAEEQALLEKKENRLEIWIAILLGITALLVAWATWIGSLHGGNQATNYTMSNNYASEGNAEYNAGSQSLIQDMMIWNTIQDYMFEEAVAVYNQDEGEAQLIQEKVENLLQNNCSEQLLDAINWAFEQDSTGAVSPFLKEGMVDSYFTKANELLTESQVLLEEGKNDNRSGDRYGLVTVIYSLVLFLLGIVGIFKRLPNRRLVFYISIGLLVLGTIFMLTIPMPTGFNFFDYFKS